METPQNSFLTFSISRNWPGKAFPRFTFSKNKWAAHYQFSLYLVPCPFAREIITWQNSFLTSNAKGLRGYWKHFIIGNKIMPNFYASLKLFCQVADIYWKILPMTRNLSIQGRKELMIPRWNWIVFCKESMSIDLKTKTISNFISYLLWKVGQRDTRKTDNSN